jgi:hypothetical protein
VFKTNDVAALLNLLKKLARGFVSPFGLKLETNVSPVLN